MSIEKKSLISTLKTTKKANVAAAPVSAEGIGKIETNRKGVISHNRKGVISHNRKAVFGKS